MMLALAMGGMILGCGRESAPEPSPHPAAPSSAAAGTGTAEVGSPPAGNTEPAPEPTPPTVAEGESTAAVPAGSPGLAPPAPAVDALAQAVAGAAEAAAGASAEGGSNCEQAYGSVIAMVQALQQQLGRGSGGLPDRATFVAACNELPENVQRCMVMAYAAEHREECQRATASVNDETRTKIRRMMGTGGAGPQTASP